MAGGRVAKLYKIGDKSLSIRDWAKLYGIDHMTIRSRLCKGWGIKRAVEDPLYFDIPHSSRKIASMRGEKYYNGKPHKTCNTMEKFTHNGSCVSCSYVY